jgi:hypothetical protein
MAPSAKVPPGMMGSRQVKRDDPVRVWGILAAEGAVVGEIVERVGPLRLPFPFGLSYRTRPRMICR